MTEIHPGRLAADAGDEFVVFLIGMRINRPLAVRAWWQVSTAMPRMQRELAQHPELGCLGIHNWFGRTSISLQYWKDFASLDAYARDQTRLHLPAWRDFNQKIRDNGDVGIWHETYQVRDGAYECIYGNMPRFGLGAAFATASPARRGQSAGKRIGAAAQDTPVLEPY